LLKQVSNQALPAKSSDIGKSLYDHKDPNFRVMSTLYETMYILRPDLGDEAVDQAISRYQDMLKESGAEDMETQHRGKRRLAYEINRYREGIYIQMNYLAPGTAIAPMERAMRLSEEVIRYLTICFEVPVEGSPEREPEPAASAAPLGS
jgi:small subunit ribosomal protein S6